MTPMNRTGFPVVGGPYGMTPSRAAAASLG
jgi:hypothetical protein